MDLKKTIFLYIGLIISLGSFAQGKLINAGKVGKVSGTVKQETVKPKKETAAKPKPKPVAPKSDDKYKSVGYMEIFGISFANCDHMGNIFDDYGADLYAGELKYLNAKVFYKGLANSEKEISINLKIIKEDGTVMKGKDSPEGYTFSSTVKIESGEGKSLYLLGWGNNLATSYSAGQYKYEIWYNGNMLFQKGFRIHPGKYPVINSKILKINNISFGNGDKNANLISGYGEALVENEVQYLQPQISYEGFVASEQKATLVVRIILPDGNMTRGADSPLCFTSKSDIIIKPGHNVSAIIGWGNENKTLYKYGTHRYEIWLNGDKIYETTFLVNKKGTSMERMTATSSIDQFFPLWGITLGKTTWKEAEQRGYEVKIWQEGPDRHMDVNDVAFWDHSGEGKFTSIYWPHHEEDFPASWKSKGFFWENSYDKWIETLKNIGFIVKIKKEPSVKEWSGRNTLSAVVEALSPDGLMEFDLSFDYGENGHYTSSSNTLYSLRVRYRGKK